MNNYHHANDHGRRKAISEPTLYQACRAIVNEPDGIVIDRQVSDRLVAFWSGWTNTVRPGFAATDDEREAILDYQLSEWTFGQDWRWSPEV